MKLEDQLKTLAELGIALDPNITVDDLTYSFPREEYEAKPFGLLLYIMGAEVEREPWGRPFCSRVWNFDTECVNGTGAYVNIAKSLCRVAGQPDGLANMSDHVDLDGGEAWIEYIVRGKERHWPIEVNDDWADMMVVAYMMSDLERDGFKFRARDNGQAMVLYYLDDAGFARINELAPQRLTTVTDPES
jgi:hypothetical protein